MKELIIKYLTDSLTDEEQNQLLDWIKNPKNVKKFEAIVKENYNINLAYEDFSEEAALLKVKNTIKRKEKPVKRLYPNIFKYAAAILIFISTGYFFLTDNNSVDTSTPIIVNNNIKAGTDKATLTLGDGTVVDLEKGQNYIAENIESNGEEIIYNNTNTSKSDIAYNYLTIPRGGQYLVKLSDGTQVWLNSETQLKYPVNFIDGETRQVELVYGEAYFDVSPSTNHDGAKFKVIHSKQEVEVIGTEFNIKAYNDETEVFTTLVEGIVKVDNLLSNSRILEPNQQTIITAASSLISVNTVDAKGETTWRHGVFNFKDKSFKDILRVLSRWYDMDVVVVDKEIESELFTGTFGKEQNIEDILYLINKLTNIHYEINNKTLFFRK